ncbi:MAG: DUF4097 domain-containing protein [Spirochaetaceae bacterium]|jgi:DUF4097 and DUF4098 domain-containing protein YvlB|nr:DUF4097 domain-containing protein [Spirochaetaceae bacterium]
MVLKTHLNIKVRAILMTLGMAVQSFSSENIPENHSKSIETRGITSLIISYTMAHLTLLESENDELVLKRYTNENDPEDFGNIFLDGSILSIIEGQRTSPNQTNGKIEIYIPRSYRENCSIFINSGSLTSETELILKNLAIELSSGSITLGRVSAENIYIRSASGNIRIDHAEGNMRLDAISGSILVQSARGAGTFQTSLGRITMGMEYVTGDLSFETGIGAIALSLPEALSFNFDALTGSGNIWLDSPDEQYHRAISGPLKMSVGPDPVYTIRSRTGIGNIIMNMNISPPAEIL